MRIGVLDDDPALCHLLEIMLAMAGHTVFTATNPLAFLEQVQDEKIDEAECIIVDFHVPGKTGLDVISQARKTHPNLPAILMSGDQLPETIYHGLTPLVFCRKPFHIATILNAIDQAQAMKRALPLGERR